MKKPTYKVVVTHDGTPRDASTIETTIERATWYALSDNVFTVRGTRGEWIFPINRVHMIEVMASQGGAS